MNTEINKETKEEFAVEPEVPTGRPAIKITAKDMLKYKFNLSDLIKVATLGFYGFDDALVNDMVNFDIFPQVFLYRNDAYVLRREIFDIVVNKLLHKELALYKIVSESERITAEIAKDPTQIVRLDEIANAVSSEGLDN